VHIQQLCTVHSSKLSEGLDEHCLIPLLSFSSRFYILPDSSRVHNAFCEGLVFYLQILWLTRNVPEEYPPLRFWRIFLPTRQKQIPVLRNTIPVLGLKPKRGSTLLVFQYRLTFSRIIPKVSARASHLCGCTYVYVEKKAGDGMSARRLLRYPVIFLLFFFACFRPCLLLDATLETRMCPGCLPYAGFLETKCEVFVKHSPASGPWIFSVLLMEVCYSILFED